MSLYTLNIVVDIPKQGLDIKRKLNFLIESVQDVHQNVFFAVSFDKHSFDCINCNQKYALKLVNSGNLCAENDSNSIDDSLSVKEEILDDDQKLEPFISIIEPQNDTWEDGKSIKNEPIPGKRKKYRCRTCQKRFIYKSILKNHRCSNEEPTEENTILNCSICSKTFPDEESFREHLKEGHKKDQSLVCHLCGVSFSKKSKLQYHLNHSRAHQPPPLPPTVPQERLYECHYCSKMFFSKYTIARHIKRHFPSLKKPQAPITCQVCGQSFKAPRNLRRHLKIVHEGQKPYQCHLCTKQFTSASYLKIHIGGHEGGRNYPCKFCQLTYRDPGTVAGHMRKLHPIEYEIYKKNRKLAVCE